jgi:hypothetical protein
MANGSANLTCVWKTRVMNDFWIVFWAVMIFASIAWYGFLVFYVGAKGGREIREMTRALSDRKAREKSDGID